jgi:hypothetical protein
MAAITDKSRLLTEAPSPRVVLVGDSNLAFGVDSSRLRQGLAGRFHPVNMGLHAELGLDFELKQALSGVRAGDVVVLSPAYETLWFATETGPTLWSAILRQPSAWRLVPDDQKGWLLSRLVADGVPVIQIHDAAVIAYDKMMSGTVYEAVHAAREALGRPKAPVVEAYTRHGFNEYGDQTAAWDAASKYEEGAEKTPSIAVPNAEFEQNIAALADFVDACRAGGVRVVYAYPPTPEDWYAANRDRVERTTRLLESGLHVPFLNRSADVVYEPGLFFDTPQHLRGPGIRRRTDELARDLRAYLKAEDIDDGPP